VDADRVGELLLGESERGPSSDDLVCFHATSIPVR
jgi:hypothetical protein